MLMMLFSIAAIAGALPEEILDCLKQEQAVVESSSPRVVTVTAQQPAYLHCKIPGAASMVAWTRSSDSALLTAGTQSFTSDPRFQVSKKSETDWILILRRADPSDSGCYLCEVNTEPYSTVLPVYLRVQSEEGRATEGDEAPKKATYLQANMHGDEVLLNCTVALTDSGEESEVLWTRDGRPIDLNNTHKYVWKVKRSAGMVVHTVRIRDASAGDDGDYACENRQERSSQIVHVNTRAEARVSSSPMSTLLLLLLSPLLH